MTTLTLDTGRGERSPVTGERLRLALNEGPPASPSLQDLRAHIEHQLRPLLADYDDRQELTQRCLIKTWQKARTFRGEARFTTWLHTLVRNEYLSWVRIEERRTARLRNLGRVLHTVSSSDPSRTALTRIGVSRLLGRLDANDRLIFELRCLRGMTSVEIGAVVGLTPGSVRSRVSRAAASIRAPSERR